MTVLFSVEAEIERQRRENTHDEEQRLVIIGNGVDGNPYADDNRIWVRDIGSKGANGYSVGAVAYRVLAGTGYKPEIDRHVWIEWQPGPRKWQVVMSDPDFMQATGKAMHLENPSDPHNQFRTTEGLMPLLSKPLPNGKANVQGWQFVTEDDQYGDYKGTSDDSAAISQHQNVVSLAPTTAAHHAYVLLVFNITKFFAGVDDPIEMFVSTSKSWFTPLDASDIQECIDQKASNSRTIKVYRVYTGQDALVGHADDRDLRGWLNVPPSAAGMDTTAIHVDVDGEIDGLTEKVVPVAGDWLVIEDSEDGNAKKKSSALSLAGVAGRTGYILIQDQKAQNTPGGTFAPTTDVTRVLNTLVTDTSGAAALGPGANQFTLQAGTYRATIQATSGSANNHQAWLYNVTDTAIVARGTSSNSVCPSVITVRFTIAGAKTFEVHHRCASSSGSVGFGYQSNLGTEIYTTVLLEKE